MCPAPFSLRECSCAALFETVLLRRRCLGRCFFGGCFLKRCFSRRRFWGGAFWGGAFCAASFWGTLLCFFIGSYIVGVGFVAFKVVYAWLLCVTLAFGVILLLFMISDPKSQGNSSFFIGFRGVLRLLHTVFSQIPLEWRF